MRVETAAEKLLFSTVRLKTEWHDKIKVGTCFVFQARKNGVNHNYLVTNRHLVRGANEGRLFFTISNRDLPDIGNEYEYFVGTDFASRWHFHPIDHVDIAVMDMAEIFDTLSKYAINIFCCAISSNTIPKPEDISELDVIQNIMFMGYPDGLFDRRNLTPIVRQGVTATPLQLDYNGLPAFLIDASVFPGSSGSPVFYHDDGPYRNRAGSIVVRPPRALLLGIIAAVHVTRGTGAIIMPHEEDAVLRQTNEQMIDLGVVFKALAIMETINAIR